VLSLGLVFEIWEPCDQSCDEPCDSAPQAVVRALAAGV